MMYVAYMYIEVLLYLNLLIKSNKQIIILAKWLLCLKLLLILFVIVSTPKKNSQVNTHDNTRVKSENIYGGWLILYEFSHLLSGSEFSEGVF